MIKKIMAEMAGTFWIVLGGCGSAVNAVGFPGIVPGIPGVALASGLSLMVAACALGYLSGAHFNPAVSLGMWAAGRFPGRLVLPYMAAQVAGGVAGGGLLYLIAAGSPGFHLQGGFGSGGSAELSPGGFSLASVMVTEVALTAVFVVTVAGVTDRRAPAGMAPLAMGFCLTVIHMLSIPVDNTQVNPARSVAMAVLTGSAQSLWLFSLMPLAGGVLGGLLSRLFADPEAGQ